MEDWCKFIERNIQVVAWTYKHLRGVPRDACEHKSVLEGGVPPIRQKQYKMNLKYSLLVREEIDK